MTVILQLVRHLFHFFKKSLVQEFLQHRRNNMVQHKKKESWRLSICSGKIRRSTFITFIQTKNSKEVNIVTNIRVIMLSENHKYFLLTHIHHEN